MCTPPPETFYYVIRHNFEYSYIGKKEKLLSEFKVKFNMDLSRYCYPNGILDIPDELCDLLKDPKIQKLLYSRNVYIPNFRTSLEYFKILYFAQEITLVCSDIQSATSIIASRDSKKISSAYHHKLLTTASTFQQELCEYYLLKSCQYSCTVKSFVHLAKRMLKKGTMTEILKKILPPGLVLKICDKSVPIIYNAGG